MTNIKPLEVEEVKKIIESYEEDDQHFRGIRCTLYHELAQQICQLFPKLKLPPNPYNLQSQGIEYAWFCAVQDYIKKVKELNEEADSEQKG